MNSEEIKPETLAIVKLRLSEGISQSIGPSLGQLVSQSVENSVK